MNHQNKLYLITSNVEAGAFETLPETPSVELIANDDLLQTELYFEEQQKICVTSEYSIETVINRLDFVRRNVIDSLKDKYKFREILSGIYPEFQYRQIKTQDIKNLKIDKKSVIKPIRGCFGTAVRVIEPITNFAKLSRELEAELIRNAKVYTNYTLSAEDFIIEEYAFGEEYAADMFYNSKGEPCIVNIFHHPMPKNEAYLHMLYNSSKTVFNEIYNQLKNFLRELNKLLKVTNFAMHIEVKVSNGKIFPIEINSMRFGGMGLGNLVFYSHGVNPYTCFVNDYEPDWEELWKRKEKDVYTFFIAYNGINKPILEYKPNREKLKQQFTKVLYEQPFDYQKQLAFGIFFLKETEENILKLKKIEFDDFFEAI